MKQRIKQHRTWYLLLGLIIFALSFTGLAYADNLADISGDTGKYTLSIKVPEGIDTHVLADGYEKRPIEVSLVVSGATADLENAYIRFENTSAANGDGFITYNPADFTGGSGHTIAEEGQKIIFDRLHAGDNISFYENVGFKPNITPSNYQLDLKVVLYSSDGVKLAESPTTATLYSIVNGPKITAASKTPYALAGVAENGYIKEPKEVPIHFSVSDDYEIGQNRASRYTDQIII